MKNLLFLGLLLFFPPALLAQKKGVARADSLRQVIKTTGQDTTRIKALNTLASELFKTGKADTAIELSLAALKLAKKINFAPGEADSYFALGQANASRARPAEALSNYLSAGKLYDQLKRAEDLAETYYAMGMIHQRSKYDDALGFFKKGLQTAQQTSNKDLAGKIAYIIAVVLIRKSEYNNAAAYKDLAIKYYTASGNETGLANCYVVSARINNQKGNVQQSLKDNYAALRLFEKSRNKVGIYNVHTGIGLSMQLRKTGRSRLTAICWQRKLPKSRIIKMC